jgi:hypothetical protein
MFVRWASGECVFELLSFLVTKLVQLYTVRCLRLEYQIVINENSPLTVWT